MARLNFTSQCPCGAGVSGRLNKPTPTQKSIAKVYCSKCGSKFLMSSVRDKWQPGRGRVFTTDVEILELSQKAHDIVATKPLVRAKILGDKLGLLPDEKRSAVQTDLDEG